MTDLGLESGQKEMAILCRMADHVSGVVSACSPIPLWSSAMLCIVCLTSLACGTTWLLILLL